ncbi:X-Pro dipeptidyl-peptidase (S15 family) [Fontimonas thermophila]|uniref:X-Pro dipeptidyl-peptidase (S15 family) n=2 Tax=Fontimonas thermophila TaxID=1076937 RepID=A0A1I2HCL1_9GAMM|nr:X-Pro dipeptidyl-peptidase (S15 family) [Fontimonas thermophila]
MCLPMRISIIRCLAAGAAILLAGCGNSNPPGDSVPRAEARYFTQVIPSFDGTPIATTVFVPPLAEGERAPLILHSNGWGDTRTKQPTELTYDPNNFYGDMHHGMVTRMWRAGYVVISLDNRGWGDSGGQARIMDPDKEIRDYSVVIDWAEVNLPIALEQGRAKVGAVGGSYGGGFQIPLAHRDPRIKAIAPWVTWHDLRYSLAPDTVMRSGHVTLLNLAGLLLARVDPFIPRAYTQTLATNTPPQDVLDTLKHHSPIEFCEQGAGPKVDALIVQGTRDTLFDGLEGWQNAECLRAQGADVRLIYVPNGHLFTQQGVQSNPTTSLCGPLDPFEAVVAWYDEKLRGIPGAAAHIPGLCLPVTDTEAVFPAQMPIGGLRFEIPATPVVWTPGTLYNEDAQFVPLATIDRPQHLAGLPRLSLSITATVPAVDPILFVGIGVQRAGGAFELIDDQLRPLRGVGARELLLPVIATRLAAGDTVGLALYTSHGQYFSSASRIPFTVTVAGALELPLLD